MMSMTSSKVKGLTLLLGTLSGFIFFQGFSKSKRSDASVITIRNGVIMWLIRDADKSRPLFPSLTRLPRKAIILALLMVFSGTLPKWGSR